jgi:hypothetical protein
MDFSAAISAFFRILENLRGDESIELHATTFLMETLAYSVSAIIATIFLGRRPQRPEAQGS